MKQTWNRQYKCKTRLLIHQNNRWSSEFGIIVERKCVPGGNSIGLNLFSVFLLFKGKQYFILPKYKNVQGYEFSSSITLQIQVQVQILLSISLQEPIPFQIQKTPL